ncbi:MAG TPA: photosynthetic reaction center subunit H [Alphaproteobacteria bacterium]|nr:MAG: photosynthetic reaction center subunit H [SAR116 cluster bacterium]HBQ22353.1 photosynthetic reaction center subunit H [Alphaproteobacteria bacterium]HCJ61983.1 photosynthetic reaction center subunit H [Alphaproteobacteria bacterium]HCY48015.1 photosynthetic reaction center subunit H [Alphaproteobacteria bacterium]|tara:strand:+ start:503 stop:1276 length:774 start_codon:yes stop_codon:yes gene_type:complete
MVGTTFFGDTDLATLAIWGFWVFFAGLIYYLQKENSREGFPVVDDDGVPAKGHWGWAFLKDKTFLLPHGRGSVTVPSGQHGDRDDLALARSALHSGAPYIPTGNPMIDGVGPASWAPRQDHPELDAHGHVKIRPMSQLEGFKIAGGRDPRGKAVVGGDGEVIGRVIDVWVDVPEALIRFLTIDLNPEGSGNQVIVPLTLANIKKNCVLVKTLHEHNWQDIPRTKSMDEITLLEEEKISAYVAGGAFYARQEFSDAKL